MTWLLDVNVLIAALVAAHEHHDRVSSWLGAKVAGMRAVWTGRPEARPSATAGDLQARIERLIRVLLLRTFNHQSRGRQEPILPGVRRRLEASVSNTGKSLAVSCSDKPPTTLAKTS